MPRRLTLLGTLAIVRWRGVVTPAAAHVPGAGPRSYPPVELDAGAIDTSVRPGADCIARRNGASLTLTLTPFTPEAALLPAPWRKIRITGPARTGDDRSNAFLEVSRPLKIIE